MRKIYVVTTLSAMMIGLFLLTGCSSSSKDVDAASQLQKIGQSIEDDVAAKATIQSEYDNFHKKLYYVDDAQIVEDLLTGDLLIYTTSYFTGGHYNPDYKPYRTRDSMSDELIEKLKKEVGYVDPYETK